MSQSSVPIRRILYLLPLCLFWLGLPGLKAQQVATPTFTPDGNYYNLEQSVRIDCATSGATINYTTNGMDPTSSDRTVASGGTVLVDHAVTLKASATKAGLSPSAVKSAAYNIIGKFAAGQNHSLTVKTEGTVWAWGKNANGQLGRGSTSASPLPIAGQVKTNSTTVLTSVATVAGGAAHSAAAKSDGTAWAWGSNASGQVGDGTTTQRLYAVQVKVTGGAALTGLTDVVAGADHCVALKSNGTVWAWGLNSSGQVGIGTTTTPQKNAVQVKINSSTFLTGIVLIAAGGTHSLALKSDGTVWTWGLNSSGQLGNGNTTNQSYAVQVKVVGGAALTGVADIAAGANHSLARKTDGTLWVWGSNANGQLADGTTNPVSTSKQLNAVQAKENATTFLSGVNGIAGGASHSLALKTDGTLWSWGLNSLNQLGDGTATQRVFPVQVKDTSGLSITGVVDFFGGASHSLASRSDGTAWGWGLNSLGQAGSIATGTNPNIATKIMTGSSPFLIITALGDPDGDTLLTWKERELGTNPILADTDSDTMPDNYEVTNNLNPLVNDAAADPDDDQFTNAQERAAGTNPQIRDTDGDQVKDGEDIYPLDPHFALKRTSETPYAVVEIVNDAYVERVKLNNFNSVIFSKKIGTYDYMRKSWVWRGGAPLYLMALDEPMPPPDPNTQTDSEKHFLGAADINDGEQIAGWSSYQYPVGFTGFHDVQMYSRLSHAVIGNGGLFQELGDGAVDNGVYDPTGAPSIDGTNKGQSRAVAISKTGTVAGYADFFVDVAPPSGGGLSTVISGDSQSALFGAGPPASKLPAAASGLAVSAINGSGAISGYALEPGGYYTARLWKAGVLLNLGLIPNYPHSGSTYAPALNDDHYVAGAQYSFFSGAEHRVPYLWHENIVTGGDGKMLQLPMPFNTLQSEVLGMNKDGVMVGYAYSNSGVTTGALWQNGQCFNPTYRLNPDAVSAGWSIKKLWGINDNGVIVASAFRAGYNGLVLLLPDPAVQLITPSGDPINAPVDAAVDGQNEFTFDASTSGVLVVHLKAKVLETGTAAALVSRCRFTIENIGNITPGWAQSNLGGQPTHTAGSDYLEADVTFTGLPTNNSDFGRKKVTITVDGIVKDQKVMEVFFPKYEKNHPGVDNGLSWNWFYYWNQTTAGYPYAIYQNTGDFGVTPAMRFWSNTMTFDKRAIWLCDPAQGSDTRRDGSGQVVTGIDLFANVAAHEKRHTQQIAEADAILGSLSGMVGSIWAKGWSWNSGASHNHFNLGSDNAAGVVAVDDDSDSIIDELNDRTEIGYAGSDDVALDLNFDEVPDSLAYIDVETDAGNAETIAEDSHAKEDWANPGKQHLTTSYAD